MILEGLIELLVPWKEKQIRKNSYYAKALDRKSFLKEFGTLELNLGRRSGHTTGIGLYCRKFLYEDEYVIITKTLSLGRESFYGLNVLPVSTRVSKGKKRRDNLKYFFVDNASLMREEEIDHIYDIVCNMTNEPFPVIIMLG